MNTGLASCSVWPTRQSEKQAIYPGKLPRILHHGEKINYAEWLALARLLDPSLHPFLLNTLLTNLWWKCARKVAIIMNATSVPTLCSSLYLLPAWHLLWRLHGSARTSKGMFVEVQIGRFGQRTGRTRRITPTFNKKYICQSRIGIGDSFLNRLLHLPLHSLAVEFES